MRVTWASEHFVRYLFFFFMSKSRDELDMISEFV